MLLELWVRDFVLRKSDQRRFSSNNLSIEFYFIARAGTRILQVAGISEHSLDFFCSELSDLILKVCGAFALFWNYLLVEFQKKSSFEIHKILYISLMQEWTSIKKYKYVCVNFYMWIPLNRCVNNKTRIEILVCMCIVLREFFFLNCLLNRSVRLHTKQTNILLSQVVKIWDFVNKYRVYFHID